MTDDQTPPPGAPAAEGRPAPTAQVWWATCRPLSELDRSALSREEHARVDRLGTEPARQRSALARVLLRAVLAETLGGAPASFPVTWARGPALDADARTAPATSLPVEAGPGVPSLSLSHSGDRVVVAIGVGVEVGVDIETAARGERLRPTVVERITTTAERGALAALESPARERAAIQLWTAKEAILKATRDGLETEPHTVEFLGLPREWRLAAHAARPRLVGASTLVPLSHDAAYVGSIALLSGTAPVVAERDGDDLLR